MEAGELNDAFFSRLDLELDFTFTKSSGPGGQHVNKTSTRVELRFNIYNSGVLTPEQKETVSRKLKTRISQEGLLILTSQTSRSQTKNKQLVIERFHNLITRVLKPVKNRIPTQPSESSKTRRLESKRKLSEQKQNRKMPEEDDSF